MKRLYMVLMNINALLLFIVVYIVNKGIIFNFLGTVGTIGGLVVIVIILGRFCLLSTALLPNEVICGNVERIECANDKFLPTYLGYFFIALSVSSDESAVFVGILLLLFNCFSQTKYFNPVFLLFRYHFYEIALTSGKVILVVSKKGIPTTNKLELASLKRINDYTFINEEK